MLVHSQFPTAKQVQPSVQLEMQGASIVERPLGMADVALSASCSLVIWTEDALQVRCASHLDTSGRHMVATLALQVQEILVLSRAVASQR